MHLRSIICLCAASLLFSIRSPAQENDAELSELVETYTNAKLENPIAPRYPRPALRDGREGWVILSYIVTAEGDIAEPMIEDSSGAADFERAALGILDEWQYEPALLNGKPVDQSLTKYRIVFRIENGPVGASKRFRREFNEIEDLVAAQELEEAGLRLSDLQYSRKYNLYEDAWFWWLNFKYLKAAGGDSASEPISSLRKAIGYEEFYLSADILTYAFLELFILQVQTSDLTGAASTFRQLQDSKEAKRSEHYDKVLTNLEPTYNELLDAINGYQTLSQIAKVGANGYWVHDLTRRTFSLGDVNGRLEMVDIRCKRHTMQYSVSESSDWTIPDSWENCGVYIKGNEGTTFTFYELPNQSD